MEYSVCMDITQAVIYLHGEAITMVGGGCLARMTGDAYADGSALDSLRNSLYTAFSEIYETDDIEIIFPELESI